MHDETDDERQDRLRHEREEALLDRDWDEEGECSECGQPLRHCDCEDPPTSDVPFVDVFGII